MKPFLVDRHCHLDFPDFEDDIAGIIDRAGAENVGLMVTICTRIRQFEKIHQLALSHQNIYCSVGTHPNNANEETDISIENIIDISCKDKVVAIGEAGLDYHYDKATPANQAAGLRNHIAAARETQLPLVIHARDADADMISILEDEMGKGAFPAILHCFSSGRRLAEVGVDLGLYVSFSGILTFKSATEIQAIAADIPMDRLLVETDAPYLAPTPFRGKRNEPAYVTKTAAKLAELKGVTLDEITAATTENFFRLFTKVPRDKHMGAEAA